MVKLFEYMQVYKTYYDKLNEDESLETYCSTDCQYPIILLFLERGVDVFTLSAEMLEHVTVTKSVKLHIMNEALSSLNNVLVQNNLSMLPKLTIQDIEGKTLIYQMMLSFFEHCNKVDDIETFLLTTITERVKHHLSQFMDFPQDISTNSLLECSMKVFSVNFYRHISQAANHIEFLHNLVVEKNQSNEEISDIIDEFILSVIKPLALRNERKEVLAVNELLVSSLESVNLSDRALGK